MKLRLGGLNFGLSKWAEKEFQQQNGAVRIYQTKVITADQVIILEIAIQAKQPV